jgi:type VI secretion system protein VasD
MTPRRRRLLVLVATLLPVALAAVRCGRPPRPAAVLTLTVVGGADQNLDPDGNPAPIAVTVYQLAAIAKFVSSDWAALTEREQATLGQDEAAASQQFVVTPGETQTRTFLLRPGVQDIGIVALYRDIDHAQWRALAPAGDSEPSKLTLYIGKASITLQPTK